MRREARPAIAAPAPLTTEHDVHQFSCGKQPLDDWLRYRAIKSERRSARTYVTCVGPVVVGYYSFSSGAVRREAIPKRFGRNMPEIIPVALLGRLAVDERYHGLRIGKGLLRDGLSRALHASTVIGSRGVLVHAIDEEAVGFYTQYGFMRFPEAAQTLFLPIETIQAVLR